MASHPRFKIIHKFYFLNTVLKAQDRSYSLFLWQSISIYGNQSQSDTIKLIKLNYFLL